MNSQSLGSTLSVHERSIKAFGTGPGRVEVHENGLVIEERGTRVQFAWEQITGLRQSIVKNRYMFVVPFGTDYWLRITTAHDGRHFLDDRLKHMDKLIQTVQEHAFPILYRAAVNRLNDGESVSFGPIEVSAEGVVVAKRTFRREAKLPWQEVGSIEVRRGYLNVYKDTGHDTFPRWKYFPVSDITNVIVLLEIAGHLTGRGG